MARARNIKVLGVCDEGLKIIYKHGKPYGIRDLTGFLFFFKDVTKYSGQEERYRQEIEGQYKLADYLLNSLKNSHIKGGNGYSMNDEVGISELTEEDIKDGYTEDDVYEDKCVVIG